jgi:TolB-like protein
MIRNVFVSLVFSCLCFFLFPSVALSADSFNGLVSKAALDIGGCLKDRDRLMLAVTGIRTSGGLTNGLTAWLADSLTSELARNRELQVLDRARLKEITNENGLSFNDLFDQSKAKALGKFLSADIMVSGTLTKMGKRFDLNLRVVDCEEGDIIPGCGFRGEMVATPDLLGLWRRFVPDPLGAAGPEPKSNRISLFKYRDGKSVSAGSPPVFKIGDRFGFCVSPPMKSRLYVLTYDPDRKGDVVFLYPLPRPPSRPAEKDETCMFPTFVHAKVVSYPVGGPEGKAELKAIWVEEREGGLDLEGVLKESRGPGLPNYTLSKAALSVWLKQIQVLPASSWGEETVEYWIENP